MLALLFLVAKVGTIFFACSSSDDEVWCLGAASDKVAALEKAGVIVTDSPAKIGSAMLKVCHYNVS